MYRSHLLIRQTLKILLNEKISGFKQKLHWDLMLKMVFRCNSLYFVSLIVFMDGLFLDNDFRTLFSYFIIPIAVVDVLLVLLLFILPFYYDFIFLLLLLILLLLSLFLFLLLSSSLSLLLS